MAKNKKYTVRVSYKVYDYYTIEAENEQEAIEQALETSATDSLNDYTQDGEGEAIVTMIDNKSVEPEKKEQEAIMVLCSYDEDDDVKDMILSIRPADIKKPETIIKISQELRRIFCADDYVAIVGDVDEQEFQEATDNLANGRQATFKCYKWYWEKVGII